MRLHDTHVYVENLAEMLSAPSPVRNPVTLAGGIRADIVCNSYQSTFCVSSSLFQHELEWK